jgi:hypothetical protein
MFSLLLQIRKRKWRELKSPMQGHTARKWWINGGAQIAWPRACTIKHILTRHRSFLIDGPSLPSKHYSSCGHTICQPSAKRTILMQWGHTVTGKLGSVHRVHLGKPICVWPPPRAQRIAPLAMAVPQISLPLGIDGGPKVDLEYGFGIWHTVASAGHVDQRPVPQELSQGVQRKSKY